MVGEPVSFEKRQYKIADLVMELEMDGPNIGFHAPRWKRWEPFRCTHQKPDVKCKLTEKRTPFANGIGPHQPARMDRSSPKKRLQYRGWELSWEQENDFVGLVRREFEDSVLRAVFAKCLFEKKTGFLLHASAIATKQGAFVLSAESTTGKTTAVKNRPPNTALLSDDTISIWTEDGRAWAAGTPFGGDLPPSPNRHGLARIIFLKQGDSNRLVSLETGKAVVNFMQNMTMRFVDQATMQKAMEVLVGFLPQYAPAIVFATRDGSFWSELIFEKHRKNRSLECCPNG
jgi:hypothetical protein